MRERVSTGLEVCGASAVVYGMFVVFGLGAALIVGGAAAVAFGYALGGRR